MPDAPGLELLAQTVRDAHPDAVLDTTFFRGQAAIHVEPSQLRGAIEVVRDAGLAGFLPLPSGRLVGDFERGFAGLRGAMTHPP